MNILILSCGTGGGHNSAAIAIKEELDSRNIKCEFKEYLDIINPKLKQCVNTLYIKSTKGKGKTFKAVYKLGELYRKTKLKSPIYKLNSLNKNKLYEYIIKNNYDYIVTTHLFAAQALTKIKEEKEIHFIAIATDYVCIPFWEETNPDYFIIPSIDQKQDFLDRGIEQQKIISIGIPVSKSFNTYYPRKELISELNLDISKKYILVLTGSMGFGNSIQITEKLLKKIDSNFNVIAICGNNDKLLKKFNDEFKNNKKVIALSFTNKISKYMQISEVVLTKPGGLTSTEVATLNKPLIHTMPIPGCENYNADYFCKKGMSLKCNNIKETIQNTCEIINNKELQEHMIQNQKKYIDKQACKKICDLIIKQCNNRGKVV